MTGRTTNRRRLLLLRGRNLINHDTEASGRLIKTMTVHPWLRKLPSVSHLRQRIQLDTAGMQWAATPSSTAVWYCMNFDPRPTNFRLKWREWCRDTARCHGEPLICTKNEQEIRNSTYVCMRTHSGKDNSAFKKHLLRAGQASTTH